MIHSFIHSNFIIIIIQDLLARLDSLEKEVFHLREECKRIPILEAEIAIKDAKISELEKRLNLNSKNSHLPPSRDNSKTRSEKKRPKSTRG
jgi:hypothetical protein